MTTQTAARPGGRGYHTLLCRDRADAAAGLREHGIDGVAVDAVLDAAELHGDAQSPRVRVDVNGGSWFVDLFGQALETGAE